MFDLFATILAWFYAVSHNYAIAIAMLTLCVMIALTPLTLKGTKSMLQLQKLQPDIKRLQAEHKGDRQKLNEEMMALYKENRINPLSGCLPLLIQMPIFFILYRVLHGLTRQCSQPMVVNGQTCKPPGFNPDYIKQTSEMFKSLFGQTKMMAFGLNLAEPATKELANSFWQGLPYLILVIAVGALNYYQQRQVSARMKDNVNPQQQMIMKVLPIGFAVFALILPAGLIIYFITSSLYRIAQQTYITRKFYRTEDASGGDDSGNGAKKGKPAPKPAPATTQKGKAPASRPTPKARSSGSSGTRPQPSKSGGDGAPPAARPSPNRPTPRPRTTVAANPQEEVVESATDGVGRDDRTHRRGGQGSGPRPVGRR